MNAAEQTEIWDRYEAGETVTVIEGAIGRPVTTVWGFVVRHGHRRPPGPPAWSSARLSLADRDEISRRLVAGASFRAIARCLGRAPSTISREVNSKGGRKAYRAVKAEDRVRAAVRRPKVPRLATNTALAELLEEKLGEWWSPEQIAGWLRLEHPDDLSMRVSHETIYRSLYADDHGVLRRDRCQTGLDVYLCDPKSPWQRGTNENTNGLLRQYLPRQTDLYALTQQEFDAIAASLNDRPRRVLGWRTPRQALEAVSPAAAAPSD